MKKRELEEHVLKLAKPLLEKLYGKFSVDLDQMDRPDAAITVNKPDERLGAEAGSFRVGIEITSVDKEQDLAYLNDEKYGRDKVIAQTMDALQDSVDCGKPIKKVEIEISETYIYDGAILKKDKYQGYFESGSYREIILLCFSSIIATNTVIFREHLQGWTNHILSKAQFPFDAVVVASLRSGEPVRVYQKSNPLLASPAPSNFSTHTETVVRGPTMRVGQKYNLLEIMSRDPLISQRRPKPAP